MALLCSLCSHVEQLFRKLRDVRTVIIEMVKQENDNLDIIDKWLQWLCSFDNLYIFQEIRSNNIVRALTNVITLIRYI